MVYYLHFPSQLTEEEEMLKKKYEQLRRKKKALQDLMAPKQEPPPPKPIVKPNPSVPKKDAKEVAKILLKTGAISAIKVTVKESQGFKRTKALERKRYASDRMAGGSSVSGYQPFAASHMSEDEQGTSSFSTDAIPSTSGAIPKAPVKKLYESFTSARKLEDEVRDDRKDFVRRGRERDFRPGRPRQGNTVYIRGLGVTQEILQKVFGSIGRIINITMEMDKNCGFVSFEKIEEADRAIREVNGLMYNNVRLNVSLARNQPLIPPSGEDSSSLAWGSLAVNYPQKGSHEDTRELIVYDDII